MDMTYGNPWGVPWDLGEGTMGAPWVESLGLLGLKGALCLVGPLGLIGPQGFIGTQGLIAPQGTQGSGLVLSCMSLATCGPFSSPSRKSATPAICVSTMEP